MGESWWEQQIQRGWKGPMGMPRGSSLADFPLLTGVWYRVSHNPGKSHLLMPGTDHSYCGLTLALDEIYLIESGYEDYYWIVEESRDSATSCKPCLTWQTKWRGSALGETLKLVSPVTEQEWETTVGTETKQRKARLDAMASTVARWIGGHVVE